MNVSLWSCLFPSSAKRDRRKREDIELRELVHRRRNLNQEVISHSRVMTTMAGAMKTMARGNNENQR